MIIITDAFMCKLHFSAVNASFTLLYFTLLYFTLLVSGSSIHSNASSYVRSEITTYQPYFSDNPGKVYSSLLSLEVAGFL